VHYSFNAIKTQHFLMTSPASPKRPASLSPFGDASGDIPDGLVKKTAKPAKLQHFKIQSPNIKQFSCQKSGSLGAPPTGYRRAL